MSFPQRYGPWALVVGAALGLGAEFCRQLAERGLNLVMVALEKDELDTLATDLADRYGIRTQTVTGDVTAPEVLESVALLVDDVELGLVVYNAGLSVCGMWLDTPLERHLKTIDINVTTMMTVLHRFVPPMIDRGRGGVVLLSSMSGLLGTPMYASYAGTKALTLNLAESLWDEWRPHGVDVVAVVPGPTDTPGYRADQPRTIRNSPKVMPVAPVVAAGLAALGRQPSVIPGRANRFNGTLLSRILPRKKAVALMGKSMREMYAGE
ncbi:SDR family NAD(P)-dependent oxidoreductase [Nocardia mikamii]|uniref:SDR family NAD(P)-dependent oxidoreductase n=1 Tax=Nocardia mikamii TaxID=508464 RepID=UPI0007A3F30B|nr:SDR family NAD(P)-dependent oxidoreductase [Nocardia mikamii]